MGAKLQHFFELPKCFDVFLRTHSVLLVNDNTFYELIAIFYLCDLCNIISIRERTREFSLAHYKESLLINVQYVSFRSG